MKTYRMFITRDGIQSNVELVKDGRSQGDTIHRTLSPKKINYILDGSFHDAMTIEERTYEANEVVRLIIFEEK